MLDMITTFNFSDRSCAFLRNTSLAVTSQHSPQRVTCPPSAVVEPRAATDHAHSYHQYISLWCHGRSFEGDSPCDVTFSQLYTPCYSETKDVITSKKTHQQQMKHAKLQKTACQNAVNRRRGGSITYKKTAVNFSTHNTISMVKNTPLQNVMACKLEAIYQPCGNGCCLLLQGRTVSRMRKKGVDTGARSRV
jgi:hypothetical protein